MLRSTQSFGHEHSSPFAGILNGKNILIITNQTSEPISAVHSSGDTYRNGPSSYRRVPKIRGWH